MVPLRQPLRPASGWHQGGGELRVSDNIVLIPLSPYAPELIPMENVWEYLRANKLSARIWDTYDQVLTASANPGIGSSPTPNVFDLSGPAIGQRSTSSRAFP